MLDQVDRLAGQLPGGARADEDGGAAVELRALSWSQRSSLLARSGQVREALAALDRAVVLLAGLGERDQVVLLLNRGVLGSQVGDLAAAGHDLARAADLARQAGIEDLVFMARHNQGWVSFLRGDLPRALAEMDDAARLEGSVSDAVASLDRGRVLLEAGLLHEASTCLREAVARAGRDQQTHVVLEATIELARTELLRGDVVAAESLLAQAEHRALRRRAAGWRARAALGRAALGLRASTRTAERVLDEATAIARDSELEPSLRHAAGLLRAEALVGSDRPAQALAVLTEVDEDAATGPRAGLGRRLDRCRVEALARRSQGDDDGARRALDHAADELDAAAAYVSSLDLRTAVAVHANGLAGLDLEMALADGPGAALLAADRWRARSARVAGSRPVASPELAALLAELRRTSEAVRAGDADPATARRVEALELQASRTARTLAARSGPVPMAPMPAPVSMPVSMPVPMPGSRGSARSVAADGLELLVEATRAEGVDLLTTVVHGGQVLGLGVVGGEPVARVLGPRGPLSELARCLRADAAMAARIAHTPLAAVVRGSLAARAAELCELVVAPFGSQSERLVVVPHDDLNGLAWPVVLPGRAVCVSSSAAAWASGLDAAVERAPRLAVIAGPRLSGAPEEVAAVARCWAVHGSADGAGAGHRGDDLRRAVAQADVVHVAAHGRHDAQNPMFSSLELDDGPLFLYDLESSGVSAAHIVLAACEVGRSVVRPGEEPLGLAAGLLALGARCVVAATCAIPDEVATTLMPRYHRALREGSPSDVALRDAAAGSGILAGLFVTAGTPWRTAHGD